MAGMERFDQRARRVLSLAHQEAEHARNNIGPEHLLLGLMDEEGGVAGRVLRELGMTSDRIREVIRRVTNSATSFDPSRIELSSDTQQVLEHGVDEARRLGHHYIGTEHILLGLVLVDSAAMEVLRRLGVTAEQIRRQTRRVLNESASSSRIASSDKVSTSHQFNQVFILHGTEEQKKNVAALIQILGLVPVLLDEKNEGKTLVEMLDRQSNNITLAIVILAKNSPEIGRSEPEKASSQLDINVIYELGYFRGKLGRSRVCVLYLNDFQEEVKSLSNLDGIVFISLDTTGAWMTQLAKTIQDAGIKTNLKNML